MFLLLNLVQNIYQKRNKCRFWSSDVVGNVEKMLSCLLCFKSTKRKITAKWNLCQIDFAKNMDLNGNTSIFFFFFSNFVFNKNIFEKNLYAVSEKHKKVMQIFIFKSILYSVYDADFYFKFNKPKYIYKLWK